MTIRTWGPWKGKTIEHRFFEKCWYDPETGCIQWMAALGSRNYGAFTYLNEQFAHRLAYRWGHGEIPTGLVVDHLCRNRSCVNPEHMEAVTMRENVLRGEGRAATNARKTHCHNGHVLAGSNLMASRRTRARRCRPCFNAWQRAYRQTIKQQKEMSHAQ